MAGLMGALRRAYGIARSAVIYHADPWKRRRAQALYRQFLRPGDLAFDVGAHLGDRSGDFRALGARVVAVEPNPALAALLRWRFGRDRLVTVVEAAIGAAPGEAELMVDPANPTVASLSPVWRARVGRMAGFRRVAWRDRHLVAVTTLDALIAAHGLPAFCKIDVEGFEAEVLAGLSQPVPALSLEYIPGALDGTLAAIARLEQLGRYTFNRAPGESMRFVAPEWRSSAEIVVELERLPADARSGDVYARHEGGGKAWLKARAEPSGSPAVAPSPV